MSLGDLKALCFDVFGTVVDWRESIAREAGAALSPLGITRDWHAFADAWRARYQPALEEVRSGRRPWARLDDLHRENLLALLEEHAIGGLSEAEIDHLNRAWHRLDPWPDAIEGLSRLKRRFILATLSNGNVALMVNMAKRAGLPWDVILGAEVAGAYKPQPEAYLRSAALLDLAHKGGRNAAAAAQHIAEAHGSEPPVCVVVTHPLGRLHHQQLAHALGGAHDRRRVDRLVG